MKVTLKGQDNSSFIPMSELKPGQLAEIVQDNFYLGHIVIRINADLTYIIDLTRLNCHVYWKTPKWLVRVLGDDEVVELRNEGGD